MARRTKYSKELAEAIANSIRKGSTKKSACIAAGICEDTFFTWLKDKPEFSELITRVEAEMVSSVENKLYQLATNGSIRAIEFLLKNRRRDTYTDTIKQEISGPNGGPLEIRMIADAIAEAFTNAEDE